MSLSRTFRIRHIVPSEKSHEVALVFSVRNIRTADDVHSRTGDFQTNLATFPEHVTSSLRKMK